MNTHIKSIVVMLLLACFATPSWAQTKTQKLKERFNTREDVRINLDTQYADVVFENWNKDEVEIEAFLETDGLSKDEINALLDSWRIAVQGNSSQVQIKSGGTQGYNISMSKLPIEGIDKIIASSLQIVEPVMENMIGPMLENFTGTRLPPEYYKGMRNMKFDYDEYKKRGEAYLEEYNRKIEKNFGDDFDKVMDKWEKENEDKMKSWEDQLGDNFLGMPKSPYGKNNMNFDANTYEKDKRAYVAKLNKKYGTNVTVRETDHWLNEMEAWGEDFGKGMEAWGERFGEQFGKSMEAWGENFGKAMERDMEAWGENFGKAMEEWGENFGKQMEQWAQENEGNFTKSEQRDEHGNVSRSYRYSYSSNNAPKKNNKGLRKIIVRMPDDAKLDLNVRHGSIKLGEANNARVNLSHGGFVASTIDGNKTHVTVAYSPVEVNNWNYGTLRTSYVKKCVIANAKSINVDSRSSNVIINELDDTAMITGSFGELTIPKVGKNFKTLSINLENSDLVLRLPDTAFHFTFNGTRSNLNYPKRLEAKVMENYDNTMINGFHKSRNTDSAITISAKFSDVVVN